MMEAKLRQLEAEKAAASKPEPASSLPHHPSLPLKPAASLPNVIQVPADGPQHRKSEKPPNLLSGPVSSASRLASGTEGKHSRDPPKVARETKSKLTGVIIKRVKPKKVDESTPSKESTPGVESK